MSSLPETLSTIQVDLLRTQELTNEEIIELLSLICSAESVEPYIDHVQILYFRYDMSLEVRPLELEILSMRDKFTVRVLRNFFIATQDHGYHSLLPDLMTTYQNDVSAAVYLQNIEAIFNPSLDEGFIRDTLRVINNSDMSGPGINSIRRHFQNKLDRIAEYAPIPKYIRDIEINTEDLPRIQEREVNENMPNELIADYLVGQLGNLDIYFDIDPDIDDITPKDILIDRLNDMNRIERRAFVDLFRIDPEEVKSVRANRDIFRVYGPGNPYSDTDFSDLNNEDGSPNIDLIFGGARMFTDMSLTYDEEEDLPIDDWFLGYCLQCSKRIRAYFHAVREPNFTGGWRGCYCSWDCVREYMEHDFENDPDTFDFNVAKMALTRQIELDMGEYQIADRDYEDMLPEDSVSVTHTEIDQDVLDDMLSKLPNIQEVVIPIAFVPEDLGPY